MSDPEQEMARLQAEVARLEGELSQATSGPTPEGPATRRGRWRPAVVVVLLILVGLLAPLSVVAIWAHDEIGDTDRYVDSVEPLASDPAVQDAVTTRLTDELFVRLDVEAVTRDAVDALAERGLPPRAASSLSALATPLANAIHGFVEDQVGNLVRSDEFQVAWVEANRQAHSSMVAVLTGETGETVQVEGDTVSVNLSAVLEVVEQRLVDAGFTLVENIPPINVEFTIMQSADLARAQNAFDLVSTVARVLPWLALLLLGLAVWVARDRRRALVAGALVVAASMVLLGAALNAFRIVYLDAVPTDVLPRSAAAAIYDELVRFIRFNLRAVLVLFLAVAVITWVTGPGPHPTTVRRTTTSAIDAVRGRSPWDTGRLGTALHEFRTPIRVTVLGAALLAYVLAAHPTGSYALTVLGIALVVLLIAELLARPPAEVKG